MLASLDDVKRLLNIPSADTSRDAVLTKSLEVASSYVTRRLGHGFVAGPGTVRFHNVRDDALIYLPAEGLVVTSVTDPYGNALGFEQYGKRRLRLTDGFVGLGNFRSYPQRHNYLARVDVAYVGDGRVPAEIKEATALFAAEIAPAPAETGGEIIAETIGDYSYKLSAAESGGVSEGMDKANMLLASFLKRRVAVI